MTAHEPSPPQENPFRAVELFVAELRAQGVDRVCISPGSRSTPLAIAFTRNPGFKVTVHVDERSAAFFALGAAKALGRPVALVCTSGTAAANYLPAVVEAAHSSVPLLVLTADRPPEARGVGAPQTIDQVKLYGGYVRWFAELPLPESTPAVQAYFRTVARRAVLEALSAPFGPVHVNAPFREPLIPPPADGQPDGKSPATQSDALLPASPHAPLSAPPDVLRALTNRLRDAEEILIVCGPQADPHLAGAVDALARTLGAPVLADPLSQVRYHPAARRQVIDAYDLFLRSHSFTRSVRPDCVLRLGAAPTSKPLNLYLESLDAVQISVAPGGWHDPSLCADHVIRADLTTLCGELAATLAGASSHGRQAPDGEWLAVWRAVNAGVRRAVTEALEADEDLFEGRVFAELTNLLPEGAVLYVGNSMPVRDLDAFGASAGRRIRTLANRGANGIDGVVSSALGAAACAGDPVVLAIGDLSFHHDMGGLLAAKLYAIPITIVLLNNDGGGIFSFLPQAQSGESFELLFGTPHGLDFCHAAALYGLRYTHVDSWTTFRRAVSDNMRSGGAALIEVRTRRTDNFARHKAVEAKALAWVEDHVRRGRSR